MTRGAFGKLPGWSDFVMLSAGYPEVQSMEYWVQEGIVQAQGAIRTGWESAHDTHLYHRFVYRGRADEHCIVGVIRASHDSYGRRYPFVVFARLPKSILDVCPLWLAAVCDDFYPELEQLLERIADCCTYSEMSDLLSAAVQLPVPMDSHHRYGSFLDEVSCEELGLTCNHRQSEVHITTGWHQLSEKPSSLSIPLNQPRYARGTEVRFWIELRHLMMDRASRELSLFWPTSQIPVSAPRLLMSDGAPASRDFPALLGTMPEELLPESTYECVIRLGYGRRVPSDEGDFSARPLRDLLRLLSPGYPKSCEWNKDFGDF